MKTTPWLLLLLVVIAGCEPDTPDLDDVPDPDPLDELLYIGNEGNYNWGNASVTRLNRSADEVTQNVFTAKNDIPLGDVLQSMTLFEDRLYLVVNNSGKIEVTDPRTLQSLGTITGLSSPRSLLPLSSSKAYVSDLYADAISIVDLSALTVTGGIPCPGWTEEMVLHEGKVYITNLTRNYLYVADAATDNVVDSLLLQKWAAFAAVDAEGKLWVLSQGSEPDDLDARLYRIDMTSLSVERDIYLGSPGASELEMSVTGDSLFFLHQGVKVMPVAGTAQPTELIPESGHKFYGLHVSGSNLFVTDAIDYVQEGKVYHYDLTGQQIQVIDAGRIPKSMCSVML